STSPVDKIDLSLDVTMSVQNCSKPEVVKDGIRKVILQLIENQNRRYVGICPNNCSSDFQIKIVDLCGKSFGSKQQTSGNATVNVSVNQTDAVVRGQNGRLRPSMPALIEAFYDLDPVNETLTNYTLSIDSVKVAGCGPGCVVSNSYYPQICVPGQFVAVDKCEACAKGNYSTHPVSDKCEPCPDGQTTATVGAGINASSCYEICVPGQFFRVDKCEPCAEGSYSTHPVSDKCESCPDGQTTATVGAGINASSCDGICATNKNYCGDKGTCEINSEKKHYCHCHSDYYGDVCDLRQEPEDENLKIVIGVTAGVGGLLLILAIICGILACRRKAAERKSATASLESESDVTHIRFPRFNPTKNWFDPFMYREETLDLPRPSSHSTH
ncbi:unnamed protein product, partial [Candidula unifasciata]